MKERIRKILENLVGPAINMMWQGLLWLVGVSFWLLMPLITVSFAQAFTAGMDPNFGHNALAIGVTYIIALVAGFRGAWTASRSLKAQFGGVKW